MKLEIARRVLTEVSNGTLFLDTKEEVYGSLHIYTCKIRDKHGIIYGVLKQKVDLTSFLDVSHRTEFIKEAMLQWEEQIIIYLMRVKSNPELGILSLEDMIKFSKFNHYYKTEGIINAIS